MMQDEYRAMREAYPEFVDSVDRRLLDKANIPEHLHRYIPYAEVWGVVDDLERENLTNRAPAAAKTAVQKVVAEIDDELDKWLSGVEADSPSPSREYVAFSAMRFAVDFM